MSEQRNLPVRIGFRDQSEESHNPLAVSFIKRETQLVMILMDLSFSTKGACNSEASEGISGMIAELAKEGEAFKVGVIGFGSHAKTLLEPTSAKEALEKSDALQMSPSEFPFSDATNFQSALVQVQEIVLASRTDERVLKPLILMWSDGKNNRGDPLPIATSLKEHADLVTIAVGSGADDKLLRRMATNEKYYFNCSDGVDLRWLFRRITGSVRASHRRGQGVTHALTGLNRHEQVRV